MVRRVAVIGAGAAGLAVLRRFTVKKEVFEVVCFEQLSNVGGLWNYCDNIDDPNHPTGSQYTAIYKNMRTNLPKQVMLFDGFPYPDELPSYISHADVKEYLERFADEFQLRKYIKFNKRVLKVDPKMVIGKEDAWMVRIEDVQTKMQEELEFDIVVVCNGKYSVPYYPQIKGMDVFKGQMIHSQRYRDPEEFRGKRVLVVGGGPSGIDIAIEIAACAEKTWLCQRHGQKITVSNEICQVGDIIHLTSDSALVCRAYADDGDEYYNSGFSNISGIPEQSGGGFQNNNGEALIDYKNSSTNCSSENSFLIGPVDVVIFCTGFYHSYPFLSADCGIAVTSPFHVGPLYKDLICVSRPTLSVMGLFSAIVPFVLFDCQAQFLVALYEGKATIPTVEKLEEDMEKYNDLKHAHGVDVRMNPFKTHIFQWVYYRHLASIGNFTAPPHCIEDLVKRAWHQRSEDLVNYKDRGYVKGTDGLYVDA